MIQNYFDLMFDPFAFWMNAVNQSLALREDLVSFLVDTTERTVLVADTLIERGKNSLNIPSHVMRYKVEKIFDGKNSKFPCSHNLVKVIPPKEFGFILTQERVVLIASPRTRKPGLEAKKAENQVSVAWKLGYTVYFLLFDPKPIPEETIGASVKTICAYIKYLNKLHPHPKGIILPGNCQAGWQTLLSGLYDPDLKYTLAAIGTPLSYWSGVPDDGSLRFNAEGFGGAWVVNFLSDLLGGKIFDAANLSFNFDAGHSSENFLIGRWLRTFWSIDTHRTEFLEMEHWMTNFCQLPKETMGWIVNNLFIGNNLERGKAVLLGKLLNMQDHPDLFIILNSLGDNIATVWQCQCWIPIVWNSLEELKASGKKIVILDHPDAGHLKIFFSETVARDWYGAILKNMEELEKLPSGLFGATPQKDGTLLIKKMSFEELPVPNKQDQETLSLAAVDSEKNLELYEKYVSPLIKMISPWTKDILFHLHPYRLQRYPFIGATFNPVFHWISNCAKAVKQNRHPIEDASTNLYSKLFDLVTKSISTHLLETKANDLLEVRKKVCNKYNPYLLT